MIGVEYPEGWTSKRIKYLATYNDEVLPESTDELAEIDYVEISGVSLSEGIEQVNRMSFHEAPSRARRKVQSGDILISTVRTYLRAIAKVDEASDDLIASTGFCVVRPGEDVHSGFLGWVAKSEPFISEVVARSVGVSYPAINASELVTIDVPLPPLATQRRIAGFLDEKTARIDRLIAKKRALLDRLAEKRQALITRAVTKGLDPAAPVKPSGIDWLGDIPAHWDLVPFKWRCRVQSGQVDPREPEFADMPLIAPDHIQGGTGRLFEVTTADEQGAISGKYLAPTDSVLYSKIRPALRKVALFEQECLCSADMYAIDPGKHLDRHFLFYFLLTDAFTSYAELESLRVAMPKVNRDALGAFPLPVPPVNEQRQIGLFCDEVDQRHRETGDQVERSLRMLTEYRAALITSAVTGQITHLNEDAVVQLRPKRKAPDTFKRAVLAARIAERMCEEATFGRVKFQKALHLCEAHGGAHEVAGEYRRHAAGPLDRRMMHSVEKQLQDQGWITVEAREGGKGTSYARGPKPDGYRQYYESYFADRDDTISALLDLLAPMRTEQAEIVSTAYAAWNDLLLDGQDATDEAIVHLILNEWAAEKRNVSENRWHAALDWMRQKELVPRGDGPHTRDRET